MKTRHERIREPITEEGWEQLKRIALCGPAELRLGTKIFGEERTVTHKSESLQMPRVTTEFKSKLGYLLVYYTPDKSDMEEFQRKLSLEVYEEFSMKLHERLEGMATLITGASRFTCQVTGRMGARRFTDHRGVILTLHPDTICSLKLKPWTGEN